MGIRVQRGGTIRRLARGDFARRLRPLWLLYHAVHHSSTEYTVATAHRVSFANQLVSPIFYLSCVLAGFEPLLVAGLQVFATHYQAWVHTRAIGRLPYLDVFLPFAR